MPLGVWPGELSKTDVRQTRGRAPLFQPGKASSLQRLGTTNVVEHVCCISKFIYHSTPLHPTDDPSAFFLADWCSHLLFPRSSRLPDFHPHCLITIPRLCSLPLLPLPLLPAPLPLRTNSSP